ncbi:rCG50626 [Rattus norvegicus]|uniref:RCG50626 n=1 Tax=Rattus norvegicus TaxID=10116 RepID=A6KC88_RAT|nr:rCG50626 [Rattus norvegicus]
MNSFACGKSGNKDQSPVQNPKSHLQGCCSTVSFGFLGQTALPLCK